MGVTSAYAKSKGFGKWNKGRQLPTGTMAANWKGGVIKQNGYVYIYSPDHPFCDTAKYVKRSRLVMEKEIGRYLTPEELVHHVNSIKDDDRIENLMLTNRSEHLNEHRKGRVNG